MTDDRKARLAKLAARAGRAKPIADGADEEKQDDAGQSADAERRSVVSFRNYAPRDGRLNGDGNGTKRQKLDEQDPPVAPKSVSALHQALQEAEYETPVISQEPPTGEVTKSLNWDLKRDIQPKLDKLERQTQRAIVDLLKARLQREAAEAAAETGEEDLD